MGTGGRAEYSPAVHDDRKYAGIRLQRSGNCGSGGGATGVRGSGFDSDGPEAANYVRRGIAETIENHAAAYGSRYHDGAWIDRVGGGRDEARRIRLHRETVSRGEDAAAVAAHGREGPPGDGE